MQLRLFEASPAWTIEADCVIGFDLSFTRGFRLLGLDTACETDGALSELSKALAELLCSLPEGCTVRFHSLETSSNRDALEGFRRKFEGHALGTYVARKKVEQCHTSLSPRRRELFCFVSTPPSAPFSAYNSGLLGRRAGKMLARAEALHLEKVQEAQRLASTLRRGLSAFGIQAAALDGEAMFAALWRMANPIHARRMAPPAYRTGVPLRAQLFASGLVNLFDRFERAGHHNRVLTMKLPPKQVVPTQIRELQYLPFEHHLSVVLRRVGEADALRRVETNRRQGHELNNILAKLRGHERHADLPDHALIQQQADANDVLARLGDGERLYDVATHVWFCARDEAELERRTEIALSAFRGCGQAEGAIEEMRGRFAFLSMLPGHDTLVGQRWHPLLASRAADLLPVYGADTGSDDPTTLLSTRSGEIVGFHPFDPSLPAWNATIAGGTGSGKSFATRTLLTGWLASGGRVVIATRGADYHRYAEIFGGAVCDVTPDDPTLALGPFPALGAVDRQHHSALIEHLASVVALMATEPGASLDRLMRWLIHRATQTLYETHNPSRSPTLVDWLDALMALPPGDAETTAARAKVQRQIRFWLDGGYGRALVRNQTSQPPQLSIWNLDPIHDADTQGVVLSLISGVIRRSIATAPTLVVFDEVWSILKSDAGAMLAEVLYRTVRKEGSAIWTISQSMNDYAALPKGCRSSILNNSPIKLFLQHDPSDLELVTKTFDLSEREREMLADLRSVPGRHSDLLACLGRRRQLLRLVPTGIEYWLATSHPADTRFEELARAASPDLSRLEILKRLSRRYPHGTMHLDLQNAHA